MTSYILLEKIKVEDANCIAGVTYGFPAVTNFLGFTHALSRKFIAEFGIELTGCAIFSHEYVLRTNEQYDVRFIQSKRPPVTLRGQKYRADANKTPPIIEEGKMDLIVSLLIECKELLSSVDTEKQKYQELLKKWVYQSKLAGGSIQKINSISFWSDSSDIKQLKRKLLPSFVLMDAQQDFKQHVEASQNSTSTKEIFDLWTDFFAYKASTQVLEDGVIQWIRHDKPKQRGWFVPLMIGYKGISPLYEGDEIENNRDPSYPFRFVESVHGIGDWRSSHRINCLENLIWKYHIEDEWYLCKQKMNDFDPQAEIAQPHPVSQSDSDAFNFDF